MSETRRETKNIINTRKEPVESNQTRKEGIYPPSHSSQTSGLYHDLLAPILPPEYSVQQLLSLAGCDSDVFLIAKGQNKEALNLYRNGVSITESTIYETKYLSAKYPENLIKIFDVRYHAGADRWYERMEMLPMTMIVFSHGLSTGLCALGDKLTFYNGV